MVQGLRHHNFGFVDTGTGVGVAVIHRTGVAVIAIDALAWEYSWGRVCGCRRRVRVAIVDGAAGSPSLAVLGLWIQAPVLVSQ